MTSFNARRRLIITRQVLNMTTVLILLCITNFWTLQVSSHTLHPHPFATPSPEYAEKADLLISQHQHSKNNQMTSSLVNQHALLQVHVSIGCTLDNNTKNSYHNVHAKDDPLPEFRSSLFVMITELPYDNIHTDSSLHLDQAVDLQWTRIEKDMSFKGKAFLSFLIPLLETTAERTLIVTLMEHSIEGHSRIATRRLANLPASPSSIVTPSKGPRTNPVITVELFTLVACSTATERDWRDETADNRTYNKALGTYVVVFLAIVAYFYPNKAVALVDYEEQIRINEKMEDMPSQNELSTEEQVSISPSRLRRTIVIDSPGSSDEDSTASDSQNMVCVPDSLASSSEAQARSRTIIKPPSLVRIPYSFVAETEKDESSLSVDSTEHRLMNVGGIRPGAFPSPVVDVNETGANKNKPAQNPTVQADILEQHAVVNDYLVGGTQLDALLCPVVEHVTETPFPDTEMGTEKDTSAKAIHLYKTPMTIHQHTAETEEAEDEPKVSTGQQPSPDALETVGAQNASRLPVETELFKCSREDDGGPLHTSKDSKTVEHDAPGTLVTAVAFAHLSRNSEVAEVESAENTSSSLPRKDIDGVTRADDSEHSAVAAASLDSGDKSKISLQLHVMGVTESIEGKDLQKSMSVSGKASGSIQERSEKETTQVAQEELNVQGQPPEKDSRIPLSEPIRDRDESTAPVAEEFVSNQELQSKVIDVEHVSIDESNWLRRLRKRPSAITSSSVAQDAPNTNKAVTHGDKKQDPEKEDKDEELSYVSTLPPDSDCSNFGGGDNLSFNATPTFEGNTAPAVQQTRMRRRGTMTELICPEESDVWLPLKCHNRDHEECDELPHVRREKAHSLGGPEGTDGMSATVAAEAKKQPSPLHKLKHQSLDQRDRLQTPFSQM